MRIKSYLLLFILSVTYSNALCTHSTLTKEASFWNLFTDNEKKIIGILDEPSFATTLKTRMKEYYPVLTFELGPADKEKCNFYISCDGLREGLTYVELLGTAAPELPKWNIVKYKAPHDLVKDIMIEGLRLGPNDIKVEYTKDDKIVNLKLYISGYSENDERYSHICMLLLPALLGEYTMMTKIGEITLVSSSAIGPNSEEIPFLDLKDVVNYL